MEEIQNPLRILSKIAVVFIGVGLVGAIAYLAFAQFRSQVTLQQTALKQVTYDSERRATALVYFFSEQQVHLKELAESREVSAYFENKALGMSMEYGLRASILIITEHFDLVRQVKKLGSHPMYERIVFVDEAGRLLNDSRSSDQTWSEVRDWRKFLSPKSPEPTIFCDKEEGKLQIIVSAPSFFKGRYVGQVMGWISFSQIYHYFIQSEKESSRFPDVFIYRKEYLHIPISAKHLITASSTSLPTDIQPGHPYLFPAHDKDTTDKAAYAILVPVKGTSFSLMTVIPPTEQFDFRSPRQLLYTTGGLALFIIAGMIFLVRLSTHNVLLIANLDETTLREKAVEDKNRELAAEISERQIVELSLQKEKVFVESLFETAQIIMLVLDNEGRIERFNPHLEEISGYCLDEVRGSDWFSTFLPDEDEERLRSLFWSTMHSSGAQSITYQIVNKDNSKREIEWQEKTLEDTDGRLVGLLAIGQDITERCRVEAHIRKLSHGLEHSSTAVLITDYSGCIEYVNAKFTDVTGYSSEEAVSKKPRIFRSELNPPEVFDDLWCTILKGDVWRGEMKNRRKNGEVYWSFASISPLRNDLGEITHFIANLDDINDRKNAEATINKLAYYDPLTGLPNRRLLQDRLQIALKRSSRSGNSVALLYLDLDRFKNINDSMGHHAGDMLLSQMAERFNDILRDDDLVCRLGGDEFAIILHDIKRNDFAANVAEKLLKAVSSPVIIDNTEVVVTVSIGIALYPKDADNIEILAKHADIALYHAKDEGKNTYRFYDNELNLVSRDRLRMEEALRYSLEQGELTLHYQPKVCLTQGKAVGVEALLRWHNAEFGSVAPLRFIPVAEETGLIIPIGEWVLRTACTQQVAWQQQGLELTMAVNLSAVQFNSPTLIERIAAIIDETGIQPDRLELELTESSLVSNPKLATQTLEQLRSLGISIAIDDFGTGYSSLSYLKSFPINVLKIDRSFVRDLANNSGDRAIARSIVDLANNLGMITVAEGVETGEQSSILNEIGCNYVQGFLFAGPVTAEQLPATVRQIHY